MAQPPIYERSKDFTVDYTNESDHSAINNELDGAATSINAIRTNLALIQKDDGGLKNGIVTADSIAASLITTLSAQINALLEVQFSELSLGTYFKETFIGGVDYTAGSTTQIALDGTPSSKANTTVHFDGVLQHQTEYELAANVLTFDAAIPSGVVQVEVGFANTLSEGLIGDGSVNTIHLNDAVFNGLAQVTAAANDYVVLADTSNGGGKRKALVSSVLSQIPAGGVTNAMLADSFANDLTTVTANLLDSVVIADASDSGNKKKVLVSSILDQQPAGSITAAHLSDSVVSDLTSVSAALGDSVMISDVSDSSKKKRSLISSIIALIQAASASVAGLIETSTNAEAQTATDTTRAVTPANLAATVLGIGQTWQTVTRAVSTTYTNSTGRPIVVSVSGALSADGTIIIFTINGVQSAWSGSVDAGDTTGISGVIIPNGATYSFAPSSGTMSSIVARELR